MSYMEREPERITPQEVKAYMDRGEPLTIVDVRSPDSYASSDVKIKTAIRIPPDEVEQRMDQISPDRKVVVYCTGRHEASSARVAKFLLDNGYTDVHPLHGGFEEWLRSRYPIEPK